MTIVELMQQSTIAYVQGYHTRIIAYDNGEFITLAKSKHRDAVYTIEMYRGNDESAAVSAFMQSEDAAGAASDERKAE